MGQLQDKKRLVFEGTVDSKAASLAALTEDDVSVFLCMCDSLFASLKMRFFSVGSCVFCFTSSILAAVCAKWGGFVSAKAV